ncbi:hypothetical protein Tco_0086123 [Tanacetum coccineum]
MILHSGHGHLDVPHVIDELGKPDIIVMNGFSFVLTEVFKVISVGEFPIFFRDYDLWNMRMEQYLTYTDYALWGVIMNGDAPTVASASAECPIPPKTAKQKLARKNELKARSTLLLAIPD